ncbi:MAG: NF038122 family metalloprotease [Roseiarcus sp.]|jgi:hypothetical protein
MFTADTASNSNHPYAPSYDSSLLGQEFRINDAGDVSALYGASAGHATSAHYSSAAKPAPTLIGPSDGLQFDLVWGRSVANSPSGFMRAIIDAAAEYATLFASSTLGHELIKIHVGYGYIDGAPLASNALGESESDGYLTNYATVTNALEHEGYSFSASNEPAASQFFVTSAEAKTLDLINPASRALDGFVGFAARGDWNTTADAGPSNTGTSAGLFDLQAVAAHEISEVMGRIGMEGESVRGQPTYTPLDLFHYRSPGVLELSPGGGYFSVNDGATTNSGTPLGPLGFYNDAAVNGGDIADWASILSITQSQTLGLTPGDYDAYDAFARAGVNGDVSEADIIEDAALGYRLG